jgi:uncharacterized protein (DUF1684 family)
MTDEPIDELSLADWRRRVSDLYSGVRFRLPTDPDGALTYWRDQRELLFREHPQSPVPADARAGFRAQHFDVDPSLRFDVAVRLDAVATDGGSSGFSTLAGRPGGPVAVDDAAEVVGLEVAAGAAASLPLATSGAAPLVPAVDGPQVLGFAVPMLQLPVSGGGTMRFRRIGFVDVPFPAGTRSLGLFWMEGYAGGLFLPFRDATNGQETYGAGRYLLDAAKSADLGGDLVGATLHLDFNFAYQPSCAFDPRWACPLAPPENWLDLPVHAGERIA